MARETLGLAVALCLAGLPGRAQDGPPLWDVHPVLACEQTRLLHCRALPHAGDGDGPACDFEDTAGLSLTIDFARRQVTYSHADVTPVAAAFPGGPQADGGRVDTIVVFEGGGQVSVTRFYGPYQKDTPVVALNTLTFSDHAGTDYSTLTSELRCMPLEGVLSSDGLLPLWGGVVAPNGSDTAAG